MKTFILQLEPHDDIVSVRDKMGWAKNSRVLIVWPENETILNRRLDLVLLQRMSQTAGAQMAFVSKDREVQYHAPRLGIPVFKSIRQAQTKHWRLPFRFRKNAAPEPISAIIDSANVAERQIPVRPQLTSRTLSPVVRLAFFAAGVLAFLAIAAVLAPGAEVIITPRTVVQDVLIEAYTSPEIKAMQLSGALPSEVITVEVEGRASRPVSGQIRLPDQPARGAVLFTNLTDQSIEISAGTVVQPVNSSAGEFSAIPASGSLRYATQKTVILPAGPGQTIEVSVQCLTPGKKGNQPANTLEAIEGFLGTQVSVTNPQPIDGGADRLEPAPNERDRLELARELNDSLRLTALEEMQNGLAPGDLLIPSSLVEGATLEKTFQPEDNQPADQLSLNWRLSYQARVVRFEEQLALAQAVFDANLPQGYTPMPDTLTVETVAEPQQLDEQSTSWKLHAVRRLTAQISDSLARQTVLGLPVQEAAQRMQSALQLEQTPQIHLIPDWWPRLPVLPFRIQIIQRSLYDLVSGEPPGL
ncbi:MAG: hypothetical protein B6D39_02180 [Anaerolineae bacterium UTCFX2]|jgi:hypothetical protein|nr:baseplate J/gp47 family protein [Anaerolineae bacterium]OQY94072.1 MAG: hypothetical protein B6D39_02180 [Anaerolineae bacterium UTCFX2]